MSDAQNERRRGLLYGRRQSHPLSSRQQGLIDTLLPRLSIPLDPPPHPDPLPKGRGDTGGACGAPSPQRGEGGGEGVQPALDLARLFGPGIDDYAIEVGFGGGEHLVAQARAHPSRGFIGCEPFLNGMAQILLKIETEGLTNIRLHHGDARDVLNRIPESGLAAAYVLFPDPWPKKRHWKRRFIGPDTLPLLARAIRPGGTLRVASDIADYVRWSLIHIVPSGLFGWRARGPADWRVRPADWPGTRYEAKALKAGRVPAYLDFERTEAKAA